MLSFSPKTGVEALTAWLPTLVYLEGGNTFWLHDCIEKGGWGSLIKEAVTGRGAAVFGGCSAGAIVAGSSVETAIWKVRFFVVTIRTSFDNECQAGLG